MRYAITYVSTAKKELSSTEIDDLLTTSKKNNNKKSITGVLLYKDGNFLQLIEGKKTEILTLFETIIKDERHTNIIKIFGKEKDSKPFDGYHVDFVTNKKLQYSDTLSEYLFPLETLDEKSKNVVMSILRIFLSG